MAGPTAQTIEYLATRLDRLRSIARDDEHFEQLCDEAKRRAITTPLTLSQTVQCLLNEHHELEVALKCLKRAMQDSRWR